MSGTSVSGGRVSIGQMYPGAETRKSQTRPPTDPSMETISGAEALRRLGITWNAFSRLLPDIPHRRVGRRILIHVADLEQWIERQRVQPGTLGHLYAYGNGREA